MPKGLKPIRKRLADGRVRLYWYHRATKRRVMADPTTAEGFLEVARLDDVAEAAQTAVAALPGSYAALWDRYRASEAWRALKPRTRSDYQAVRDWLGPAADLSTSAIKREALVRLRDKACDQRGRRFGNYVIQVVRLTLQWGLERDLCKANPAKGIKMLPKPRHEARVNRAWSDGEIRAFLAAAPPHIQVPFALAAFAGLRQGDALRLTWSAYDGRALTWGASKNGEPVEAPVAGTFKGILDEARAARKGALQIAVTMAGEPWSQSGFRASFFKLVRQLVKAGKLQPGCTFHGLRHTIGRNAREAGESESRIAAAIGDRSPAMAAIYGRDADVQAARTAILGDHQKRFANVERKLRTPVSNGPK